MRPLTSAVSLALLSAAVHSAPAVAQDLYPNLLDVGFSRNAVIGEDRTHVVVHGETLPALSAWYGIDPKVLAAENQLAPDAVLKPGQALKVPTRHVLPPTAQKGIVVNIPQRHLFHFKAGALAGAFPVAVGRGDWRTPTGGFHVAVKETNPSWEVPKSIQREMAQQGKPVVTSVPAGPDNPLGQYWLGFNRTGVGIHGTNSPNSIYRSATHGCIRMHATDIEQLFNTVDVKTPVTVIYQPVLFGVAEDGVYLEAHPDVYKKGGDTAATVKKLAAEAGVTDRVDWDAVKQVLAKREGIARRVSR